MLCEQFLQKLTSYCNTVCNELNFLLKILSLTKAQKYYWQFFLVIWSKERWQLVPFNSSSPKFHEPFYEFLIWAAFVLEIEVKLNYYVSIFCSNNTQSMINMFVLSLLFASRENPLLQILMGGCLQDSPVILEGTAVYLHILENFKGLLHTFRRS